jgi:hypothetical protein
VTRISTLADFEPFRHPSADPTLYNAEFIERYYLDMGIKQHKAFCTACSKTTIHVTEYTEGWHGSLVASVTCVECSE